MTNRSIPDLFRAMASLMLEACNHPDADTALDGRAGAFPFGQSLDEQAFECFDFAARVQALTDPVMAAARASAAAEDALAHAIATEGAFGPGVEALRWARDEARKAEGKARGAAFEAGHRNIRMPIPD